MLALRSPRHLLLKELSPRALEGLRSRSWRAGIKPTFGSVAGAAGVGPLSYPPRLPPTRLCLRQSVAEPLAGLSWSLRAATGRVVLQLSAPGVVRESARETSLLPGDLPLCGRCREGGKKEKETSHLQNGHYVFIC